MHVAVNTTSLVNGHTNRGVGGYTKNLLQALEKYEPQHSFSEFSSLNEIPKETDIIHYPFFDPFFLTLPLHLPKPTVVTVHDMIPIIFSTEFPKGIRGTIKWNIQKYALKRVQRIITDSENSKKDIHTHVGFDIRQIDVIPLAPNLVAPKKNIDWNDYKIRFSLSDPYFLYVGDVNWNKNVPGLLQGFARYQESLQSNEALATKKLVLVGKVFQNNTVPETRKVLDLIQKLNLESSIILPGYVKDEELVTLYEHAVALIQPSFYEGFGFPVLEAMAFGCPVLMSFTSSLGEIAGPSMRIDPWDIQSIAEGMHTISIVHPKKRSELIQKGIDWVQRYSWKSVAEQTVETYERILGKI